MLPGFANFLFYSLSAYQAWEASGNWTPFSLSPVLPCHLAWPGWILWADRSSVGMGSAARQDDAEVPDPGRQAGGTAGASWALSESLAPAGPSQGLVGVQGGLSMLG